jgi:hypothetical protein
MEELFTPLPQDFEKLAAAASVKRSSNFGKDPELTKHLHSWSFRL